MANDADSRQLLADFERGDSRAADAIFNRYVDRLVSFAHSRVSPCFQTRIEAEDVVQSAYRSFFVHARNGDYELRRSGDLWRLLASITVHKLWGELERHGAAKRSVECEVPLSVARDELTTRIPFPDEVVTVVEDLQLALDELSPDERAVLGEWLCRKDSPEAGDVVGKSPRTLRRLMARVRQQIERSVLSTAAMEHSERTKTPLCDVLDYGDYQLERMIGAGGMGKVYRAFERSTGSTVAVKSLHKPLLSDLHATKQFFQEAEVLARLRHPHIVCTRGMGRFPSGGYFIVMDFVDGIDLETKLQREGRLPFGIVLALVKQVGEALLFAHTRGIVHCDLKPANVLLTRDNHVFVSDFGFAFIVPDARRGAPHRWGGTSGYIAPECNEPGATPTAASDIYSLGLLLSVLLTGKAPTAAPDFAMEAEPRSLGEVVSRCLKRDPQQRYASVAQFLAALPT